MRKSDLREKAAARLAEKLNDPSTDIPNPPTSNSDSSVKASAKRGRPPKKNPKQRRQLTIYFTDEEYEDFQKLSVKQGVSMSALLRQHAKELVRSSII